MKVFFKKGQLMLPSVTEMNLEPGTYEAKIFPVFEIARTIQKRSYWLTFYFFNFACLQIAWIKPCRCKMCKLNRRRALLFLKPLTKEEFDRRELERG